MTAALAPAGTLEVQRELRDGSIYRASAAAPGVASVALRDSEGDLALCSFDRAEARQLIEDLELVAGLRSTGPTLGAAAALAGAVRRNFELLVELEKTDPAAADAIAAAIAAHLRSWKPMVLAQAGAP